MRGDTGADLGVVTIGDPDSYQDFFATAAQAYGAAISPDGRWIAYCSFYADTFQVYVQRFPEGGGRYQVSTEGGVEPHWSRDGSALTYLRVNPLVVPVAMVRVSVRELGGSEPALVFGTPKELFPWKYFFAFGGNHFDMTADGEHFFLIEVGPQSDKANPQLVLVQNWTQELKRLVPTE